MNEDFTDLQIPFGMRADGTLIGAAEPGLPNGLACGCVCPGCKARLVAKNQGERNRPHFAHEASIADETSCSGAKETSIHLMAKQIIADNFAIRLPKVVATCPPAEPRILYSSDADLWHKLENVRLEEWCSNLRPDIIATFAGATADGRSRPFAVIDKSIVIEIRVTHPCPKEKIAKLREQRLVAFEIDLSEVSYSATSRSLREAINLAPRVWLYHPMLDLERAKMELAIEEGLERSTERKAAIRFPRPETIEAQLAGIRKYDPAAWQHYDFNDLRQRAVMEEVLRQPMRRTGKG